VQCKGGRYCEKGEERARVKKEREGTKKEKRKIKLQDICQRGEIRGKVGNDG
jgi:hypothetical protein